jgi:hypothetical protein
MFRKTGPIVARSIRSEFVEEQERIEHVEFSLPDDPVEFHACSVVDRLAADYPANGSRRTADKGLSHVNFRKSFANRRGGLTADSVFPPCVRQETCQIRPECVEPGSAPTGHVGAGAQRFSGQAAGCPQRAESPDRLTKDGVD